MKMHFFAIIFITSFLVSYENSTDVPKDVLSVQKDTFENMYVELSVNSNIVILDNVYL